MKETNEMTTTKTEPDVQELEATRFDQKATYTPRADIIEAEDEVHLYADLPGVTEENLDITVEKSVLTIRADAPAPSYEGFEATASEYALGRYERSFSLGEDVDQDGITATLKNGSLTVVLPKVTEARTRKIEIKAG